jgi:predicted dehydrogenase
MPINVGVIGCGRIAREVHLRVLKTMPGVRVVALAEPDANALQSAKQLMPDAACFSDARDDTGCEFNQRSSEFMKCNFAESSK